VPLLAVPAFALTWWLGCYLVGRDPARPVLWRAAAALAAYATAMATWSLAPDGALTTVLLCLPALAWAGVLVALLPTRLPERRRIERGWLVVSALFLGMAVVLPPAGKLVALAPPAGALVLLWRFTDAVRPRSLTLPLTVAAVLYGAALSAVLLPYDLGPPVLALAAMGLDLLLLGYLVAVADAVDAGERLHPDLRRSAVAAALVTVLCGTPAALTMLAAPGEPVVGGLQFVLLGIVLSAVGLGAAVHRALDRLAFVHEERLRVDRAALLLLAEALPRRRERHRLIALDPDEFARLTRRALETYGDPGRLLRSPLVDLPAVDRRVAARGRASEQPLARAVELQAVLRDGVERLRPEGALALTEEWRLYHALHYCCVRGLRPYDRAARLDGLDRDARRVVEWFRRYVPRRNLRRWQDEGARRVAERLWRDLVGTDPRWLTRASAGTAPGRAKIPTRSAYRPEGTETG
jgi:hypothetical protein